MKKLCLGEPMTSLAGEKRLVLICIFSGQNCVKKDFSLAMNPFLMTKPSLNGPLCCG